MRVKLKSGESVEGVVVLDIYGKPLIYDATSNPDTNRLNLSLTNILSFLQNTPFNPNINVSSSNLSIEDINKLIDNLVEEYISGDKGIQILNRISENTKLVDSYRNLVKVING